ncbi:hypothetical protein EDEG_03825 [Edhazardia aedis USNM 41457]|uniref:Uncharacterized protein n=1 Tax=Edhazardia aedis (strain USNM 41457) TaxID=1003232 RepID=J8ZPM5_EDHAE|nr:hypothetical protein EDEG_03825 [Edhazardia aedis USNM 41457]|eukprot:EJW01633.1 hypothetical protein EDEG_03825 [Edhazardia aedis USNM 41457]
MSSSAQKTVRTSKLIKNTVLYFLIILYATYIYLLKDLLGDFFDNRHLGFLREQIDKELQKADSDKVYLSKIRTLIVYYDYFKQRDIYKLMMEKNNELVESLLKKLNNLVEIPIRRMYTNEFQFGIFLPFLLPVLYILIKVLKYFIECRKACRTKKKI